VKLIGRGGSADIFEYEQDKFIKLYRNDFPQDAINHEFRMSQLVHALGGIHTPQAFELVCIDNRQGVIFQRIHGKSLLSELTSARAPLVVGRHAGTLAALHYEVHSRHTVG
jgi:hypothetical protein